MDAKNLKLKEECYLCGQLCAPKMLKIHIRNHTNVVLHDCDECNRRFNSKKSLKAHKMLHKTNFTCEDCNRKYITEERFKNHICTPEKLRNHICQICSKKFLSMHDLKRHIRSHTNERPFACHVCNKSFTQKGNRDAHCRSHNKDPNRVPEVKEKKYVCGICLQSFAYKQHLNRHNLTHSGERPHVCNICHKGFIQRYHMKLHMQIHSEEMNFKCEDCDKYFKCKTSLNSHQKRHRRPNIFCSLCEKGFYSKSEYDVHFRTHTNTRPYTCDICHKSFVCSSSLQRHYIGHTKPKIKTIKQESHTVPEDSAETLNNAKKLSEISFGNNYLHSNFRQPYECHICDKIFTHKSSLKKHHSTHSKKIFKSSYSSDKKDSIPEVLSKKFDSCAKLPEILLEDDESLHINKRTSHDISIENVVYKCFSNKCHLFPSTNKFKSFDKPNIEEEQYYDEISNCVQEKCLHEVSNNIQENCIEKIENVQNSSFDELSNNSKDVDMGDKQYLCLVCKKVFVNNIVYENHVNKYWHENFECCICDHVYHNQTKLKEHYKVHDLSLTEDQYAYLDKKPYSCNVCKNLFATELLLKNHNLKFMQVNLQCCMCGAAFDFKADLIEHHIIHNNSFTEKPHICFISKIV